MANKIILKENGLSSQPSAPTGYRYLGYDGSTISEKTGATVSGIGGGSSALIYRALLTHIILIIFICKDNKNFL